MEQCEEPIIDVQETTFGDDLYQLFLNPICHDVIFVCEDHVQFKAHSVILSSASTEFGKLFGHRINSQKAYWKDVNAGSVRGFTKIYSKKPDDEDGDNKLTVVHTSADIPANIFKLTLEFLYRGTLYDLLGSDYSEVQRCAALFNLSTLFQVALFVSSKYEYHLTKDIANYNNRNTGIKMKEMFLNEKDSADITFHVKGKKIYAHRCILAARSEVMAAMFSGNFMDSSKNRIEIFDASVEAFLTLLGYLYSDQPPANSSDLVGTLVLADRYNLIGLLTRCELLLTVRLVAYKKETGKANSDVVRILNIAKMYNAIQLSKWCLFHISHNYEDLQQLKEFQLMSEEDCVYIKENRCPPVDCIKGCHSRNTIDGMVSTSKSDEKTGCLVS